MSKTKKLLMIIITTILIAGLTGCNFPWRARVNITITSHENEQSVVLGEETRIVSLATASTGIKSVDLYINGALLLTESPPEGSPTEFTADQPWTPEQEGNIVISVVANDAKGNASDPISITLQVVQSVSDADGTATPTVTVTPEGLEQTQTAQVGCTNDATFVENITIPVNSYLTGGSNFTKIWRVNNTGTCDWIGYELIHASGDLMGTGSPRALPMIAAGNNADIAVDMVAPSSPGTYSSAWRIRASDGTVFGPELTLTIIVPQPSTNTPFPTATFTSTPTKTITVTPTPTKTITVTPTPTVTTSPLSVEQVSGQITIAASSSDNLTVNCPAGSILVSGGFAAQSGLRVWHSMKNDNGWRVFANNSFGTSRVLTVYATCLHNSGGSSNLQLAQDHAIANDYTHLIAACPSGSIVTGGGWVIGTNDAIQIYNSSISGNGWQIYIDNTSSNTPLINVYAICLSGVSGTTTQVSNTNGQIPSGGTAYLEKPCPSGEYVTGGGFAINTGAIIYNTSKYQNGWINYARNETATQKSMYTYAVCYSP